jgi:hypothetical protein
MTKSVIGTFRPGSNETPPPLLTNRSRWKALDGPQDHPCAWV